METPLPEEQEESPYAEDINQILNNNPKEKLFWDLYLNPENSEYFGNATRCALEAGWTDSGAKTVSQQRWFKSGLRRLDMAEKAEEVLEEMLTLPKNKIKVVDGVETAVEDVGLIKIRQDTAKHVTSTLLRKTYSTKVETEMKHSGKIDVNNSISDEEFDKILNAYGKRKGGDKESGAT